MATATIICGHGIEIDRSGVGHCWVPATDIPARIEEEIATEILDGNDECECYVATNGQHYRWS